MFDHDPQLKMQLIEDVALRRGTGAELAAKYEVSIEDLKEWAAENKLLLKLAARKFREETRKLNDTVSPKQLNDLWIGKKFDRLLKYQIIADELFEMIMEGSTDPTVLREFRSFCLAAANELGQLLHRGAGESSDGAVVRYNFGNVDMDAMK